MNKFLSYAVVESRIQGLEEAEYNTGHCDAIKAGASGCKTLDVR
jgi:hypothetical protein